jgi:hypothetical protein
MSAYLTKTRARFLGTAEIARPFDSSEMKCQAVAQETLGKAMCCLLECNCNGRGEGPDRDHLEQGSQIVDSSDPGRFLNEALRAPKSRCQREKDTSADAAMARNAPAGNVTGRLATFHWHDGCTSNTVNNSNRHRHDDLSARPVVARDTKTSCSGALGCRPVGPRG